MTYNPISMNKVFDGRDRANAELTTDTVSNAVPETTLSPVPTRRSFRANVKRRAHAAMLRSRASRQMRTELAARDDRLLRDIGLLRDHTTVGELSTSSGDRYLYGLRLSAQRRRPSSYHRLYATDTPANHPE